MISRYFGSWYSDKNASWTCQSAVRVLKTQVRTARITHACTTCGREITKGQTYRRIIAMDYSRRPKRFVVLRNHWGVGTRCWELPENRLTG